MSNQKTTRPRTPRLRQVPAVSRAIAILRLLGNSANPVGLKSISTHLSLVPSTCLHILRVLVAEDLAKVDEETKRYALGSGMLSLAYSVIERSGFATLVQPALDRLAQNWGVTTMGVEIQNNEYAIVLALARSRLPFVLHTDVGSRFPCLVSASGRLVAAYGDFRLPQLKRNFKAVPWDRPLDFAAWTKEVELSRRKGFSVDRDRYINGITVVAAPLLNAAGRITHTLAAAGLSEQLNVTRIAALAEDLRDEATRLSPLLGSTR